jgi:hypothetical protein
MRRVLLALCVLLSSLSSAPATATPTITSEALQIAVPLAPHHSTAQFPQAGVPFATYASRMLFNGGQVMLSSCASGDCRWVADDAVRLSVERPDGTLHERELVSHGAAVRPADVTDLFGMGVNAVTLTLLDTSGPARGLPNDLFLVVHNRPVVANETRLAVHWNETLIVDARAGVAGTDASFVIQHAPHGALEPLGSGMWRYSPPNALGVDLLQVAVTVDGATTVRPFAIEVRNSLPTPGRQSLTTVSGQSIVLDLLRDARDADGDALRYAGHQQPRHGTLDGECASAGTCGLVYSPAPGFVGEDVLLYTLSDGTSNATGVVTITVSDDTAVGTSFSAMSSGGNEPPVGPLTRTISMHWRPAQTFDALEGFTDPEGDALSVVAVTSGERFVATHTGDGMIRIQPKTYYSNDETGLTPGTETFEYDISDGTHTVTVTVEVTITNDFPTLPTLTRTVAPGDIVTFDVLDGIADPDGDSLELLGGTAAKGVLTLVDGTVYTYQPGDEFDSETIPFVVTDGYSAGTVFVTIILGDDAEPPFADITASIHWRTAYVLDYQQGKTHDGNGNTYYLEDWSPAANGSVSYDQDDRTLTYQHYGDGHPLGSDGFRVWISNSNETWSYTVTLDVWNQVLTPAPRSIDLGGQPSLTFDALAGLTDPDGDPLSVVSWTDPEYGTVTSDDGQQITYTRGAASTSDSFSYRVSDGVETVDVQVSVTLGAPDAQFEDVSHSGHWNAPWTFDPLQGQSDPLGVGLTASSDAATALTNGTLDIDPDSGLWTFNGSGVGTSGFTVTVTNGVQSWSYDVSITTTNSAPSAGDREFTTHWASNVAFNALTGAVDADGDDLHLVSLSPPSHGEWLAIDYASGDVSYRPTARGTDTLTVTVSDGVQATTYTVTVTVTNSLPEYDPLALSVNAGEVLTIADLYQGQGLIDADGDALAFASLTQGEYGEVQWDAGSDQITYTPHENAGAGEDVFTYTISDGFETVTVSVSVTVVIPNRPPSGPTTRSISMHWSAPQTLAALADFSDPDGDELSISAVTSGTRFSAGDSGGNEILITPYTFANHGEGLTPGTETFTYEVTDGVHTVTVTVSVTITNAVPTLEHQEFSLLLDGSVTFDVFGGVTDPDGDTLTVSGWSLPWVGTLTHEGGGTFTFHATTEGSDDIHFDLHDGFQTLGVTVRVTVGAANLPPDGPATRAFSTHWATAFSFDPLQDFTDPEEAELSVASVGVASNGTLTTDSGNLVYTHNGAGAALGTDSFTYVVTDGVNEVTVTVTITVSNGFPALEDLPVTTKVGQSVAFDPLQGQHDPDGDPLSVTILSEPASGTVALESETGRISVMAEDAGAFSFTYRVSDGYRQQVVTVTLTVAANDPPQGELAKTIVVPRTGSGALDPLLQISDPEDDALSLLGWTHGTKGGVSFDEVTGLLSYTPFGASNLVAARFGPSHRGSPV